MEVLGSTLREYIHSYKSVGFKDGWVLEARGSSLTLKIPDYVKSNFINFHLKKISGNGKFVINNEEYIVSSRISEVIQIPFNYNIHIERTGDAIGEICVSGMSIDSIPIKGEETVVANWKAIMARCGEYQGLKLVGDKLIAVEGAYFTRPDLIEEIHTTPEDSTTIVGARLVFKTPSEIVHLKVSEDLGGIPVVTRPPVIHREKPSPISIMPQPSQPNFNYIPTQFQTKNGKTETQNNTFDNIIVYDSKVSGINKNFANNRKLVRDGISNAEQFFSIDRGGVYSIPLSSLKPQSKYIVLITAKKNSGNGKLYVSFNNSLEQQWRLLNIESLFYDKTVSLVSPPRDGESTRFSITMLDDSVGQILVKRIMIMEDLPTMSRMQWQMIANPGAKVSAISIYPNPTIREACKRAATIFADPQDYQTELNCVIESTGYAGRQWIGKVAPFVNGLKVNDKEKLLKGIDRTESESDILLSKLGEVRPHKRIFLEEWRSEFSPSNADLDILKNCGQILSSSRANALQLEALLNKEVKLTTKPWFLGSQFQKTYENFYLYFEKDERYTKWLIDSWAEVFPPLYIVGTSLATPPFIKKVSEYLPFRELIGLLGAAKRLIYFGTTNSRSSILEMAAEINLPALTNNSWYLSELNTFINSNIKDNVVSCDNYKLISFMKANLPVDQTSTAIIGDAESFKNRLKDFVGIQ